MADFFLLAGDRALAALGRAPLIGPDLVDLALDPLRPIADATGSRIARLDPRTIVPGVTHPGEDVLDAGAAGRFNEDQRDEIYAQLLRSRLCHLVVLQNDGIGPGDRILQEEDPFGGLKVWYEAFRAEAAKRVGYRDDEYQHILILVCAEQVPAAGLAALQELIDAEGDDRFFDACYVMLFRLNLAETEVCHARYIWPLPVSRLLLHLRLEQHAAAPLGGRAHVLAWRGLELVPDVPDEYVERTVRRHLGSAYERIKAQPAGSETWDLAPFRPTLGVDAEAAPLPAASMNRHWQAYKARGEVDLVRNPGYWDQSFQALGVRLHGEISAPLLEDEFPAWQEATDVWRSIHGEPAFVDTAQERLSRLEGQDAEAQLATVAAQFDQLKAAIESREAAAEVAYACADHYDAARLGFVPRGIRFGLAAAAGLGVAYGAAWFLGQILETWTGPWIVAGCAFLGALLAAGISYFAERHRGERAQAFFSQNVRHDLLERTVEVDLHTQQMVIEGHRLWLSSRAGSAARKVRALLRRASAMLRRELRAEDPMAMESGGEAPRFHLDETGRGQWKRYLSKTRVRCGVGGFEVQDDRLEARVAEAVESFVARWHDLCDAQDRSLAGHLPARVFLPWLRERDDELRRVVLAEIYSQAAQGLGERGNDEWVDGVRGALHEDYYYYLSCPIREEETDAELRSKVLSLHESLPDVPEGVVQDVRTRATPAMRRWPLIGLLHEEMPVTLGVGPDGHLTVVRHEA